MDVQATLVVATAGTAIKWHPEELGLRAAALFVAASVLVIGCVV